MELLQLLPVLTSQLKELGPYGRSLMNRTEYLGAVPRRFRHLPAGNRRMFAMARGVDGATALDMTKWFDTNYHYEVPELESPVQLSPDFSSFLVST